MQNKSSMISKWQSKKDRLKLSFPQLTDDDLKFDENNVRDMLSRLSTRLGRKVTELQEIMESL